VEKDGVAFRWRIRMVVRYSESAHRRHPREFATQCAWHSRLTDSQSAPLQTQWQPRFSEGRLPRALVGLEVPRGKAKRGDYILYYVSSSGSRICQKITRSRNNTVCSSAQPLRSTGQSTSRYPYKNFTTCIISYLAAVVESCFAHPAERSERQVRSLPSQLSHAPGRDPLVCMRVATSALRLRESGQAQHLDLAQHHSA
jgi:hypothetical protein